MTTTTNSTKLFSSNTGIEIKSVRFNNAQAGNLLYNNLFHYLVNECYEVFTHTSSDKFAEIALVKTPALSKLAVSLAVSIFPATDISGAVGYGASIAPNKVFSDLESLFKFIEKTLERDYNRKVCFYGIFILVILVLNIALVAIGWWWSLTTLLYASAPIIIAYIVARLSVLCIGRLDDTSTEKPNRMGFFPNENTNMNNEQNPTNESLGAERPEKQLLSIKNEASVETPSGGDVSMNADANTNVNVNNEQKQTSGNSITENPNKQLPVIEPVVFLRWAIWHSFVLPFCAIGVKESFWFYLLPCIPGIVLYACCRRKISTIGPSIFLWGSALPFLVLFLCIVGIFKAFGSDFSHLWTVFSHLWFYLLPCIPGIALYGYYRLKASSIAPAIFLWGSTLPFLILYFCIAGMFGAFGGDIPHLWQVFSNFWFYLLPCIPGVVLYGYYRRKISTVGPAVFLWGSALPLFVLYLCMGGMFGRFNSEFYIFSSYGGIPWIILFVYYFRKKWKLNRNKLSF